MKCDSVQALLARYLREELTPKARASVKDHLSDCGDCREALAFHRSLEAQMDSEVQVPLDLRARVLNGHVATGNWLIRALGDKTMKRILISSTTLATIAVGALLIMAPRAQATGPLESFNMMRAGLVKAAKSGELSLTVLGKEDGSVEVTGTLDGQPLPPGFPIKTTATRDGNTMDIRIRVDLSPADYASLKYAPEETLFEAVPSHNSTLELIPKSNPKEKILIGLDPTSKMLVSWTALERKGNDWKVKSTHQYKPKASTPPAKGDQTVLDARVRVYIGQTATVIVSG
jgi:hypothetical protein